MESQRVRLWALRRRAMRWSCWYCRVRVYGISFDSFVCCLGAGEGEGEEGFGCGSGVLTEAEVEVEATGWGNGAGAGENLLAREGAGPGVDTASKSSSDKLAKVSVLRRVSVAVEVPMAAMV